MSDPENIYETPDRRRRYCRKCIEIRSRASFEANRERRLAQMKVYFESHRDQWAQYRKNRQAKLAAESTTTPMDAQDTGA